MRREKTEEPTHVFPLDRPAVMTPKTRPFSQFCFYAVLLLLGAAASLGCLFTAFPIEVNLLPIAVITIICAALCALQFLIPPKWGWSLSLVMALCWGTTLWLHFDDVVEAFKRVVNVISAAYSEKLNFELPIFLYLDFVFPDRERWLSTLLAAMTVFPLVWFLSWLLVKHKAALGGFALTGLFLLIPMAFSILPDVWALGAMLVFWMFLLLSAPTLQKHRLVAETQGTYQAAGTGFVRISTLLLMVVSALFLFAVFLLYPEEKYQRPQFISEARDAVTSNLNLPAIFRDGSGGNGGEYVDLSSLGERNYSGKTVLRVKREWIEDAPQDPPEKEYLKSFVGSVYTGTSWEKLSAEQSKKAADLLEDRTSLSLPAAISALLPNRQDGEQHDYSLSVESLDSNPGHVYVPYTLKDGVPLPAGTGLESDSFLRSTRLFGTKSYTYSSQTLPDSTYLPSWQERLENFDASSLLPGGDMSDTQELTDCVEGYSQFVSDTYTQLPDSLEDFLLEYRMEKGLTFSGQADENGGSAVAQYVQSVRRILSEECTYSLSPPKLPQGNDFVKFFLSESKTGYCIHFATAAVALFRSAGIPARYAEGYAAHINDDGTWSEVPDKNAHAWAEIWVGGLGWLPVEVTPAGPDAPAAYETALVPESAVPTPSSTPVPEMQSDASPSPMPDQAGLLPTPDPGAADGNQNQISKIQEDNSLWDAPWKYVIGIPALFILVALLLCGSRWIRLALRKRKFRQADRNKAGLAVFAHILRLHKQCLAVLINVPVEPPEELEQIALKARFSTHTLSEEELARLLDYASVTQRRMLDTFSDYRRFYCKYILALF